MFCQFSTEQQGDPVIRTCAHFFSSHYHAPSYVCIWVYKTSFLTWEEGINGVINSFENILIWQNIKLVAFWQSSKLLRGTCMWNFKHWEPPPAAILRKTLNVCNCSHWVLCIDPRAYTWTPAVSQTNHLHGCVEESMLFGLESLILSISRWTDTPGTWWEWNTAGENSSF